MIAPDMPSRATACWLLLIVLSAVCGCRGEWAADAGPVPRDLVVLPGAQGVEHHVRDQVHSIKYEIPAAAHPAKQQIDEIAAQMAARGYKPLREHPLNPGLPSDYVRGWQSFEDGRRKPSVEVDQWMADWIGPDGSWVEYALSYSNRNIPGPHTDRLTVIAVLTPKEQVDATVGAMTSPERAAKLHELIVPAGMKPSLDGGTPR